MQRHHISPGKALCRYCGEQIPMNRLATHIAKVHARPTRDMGPSLVNKTSAAKPREKK
jgi:hypothetical protein